MVFYDLQNVKTESNWTFAHLASVSKHPSPLNSQTNEFKSQIIACVNALIELEHPRQNNSIYLHGMICRLPSKHMDLAHTFPYWCIFTAFSFNPIPWWFITDSRKGGQWTKWRPFPFSASLWSVNEAAAAWLSRDGYPRQRTFVSRYARKRDGTAAMLDQSLWLPLSLPLHVAPKLFIWFGEAQLAEQEESIFRMKSGVWRSVKERDFLPGRSPPPFPSFSLHLPSRFLAWERSE